MNTAVCLPYAAPGNVKEWQRQNYPDNKFMSKRTVFAVRNAVEKADHCRNLIADLEAKDFTPEAIRSAVAAYVEPLGIDMPKSRFGWQPERMRLESPEWWNRRIKVRNLRAAEQARVVAGKVTKYCSDEWVEQWKARRQGLVDWLGRSSLVEQDTKEELPMMKVAAASVSNPAIRVYELKARMRGMAEYFRILGYRGLKIDVTAPSSYHRLKTTPGGKVLNERFNGATAKETQAFLGYTFGLIRSYLASRGITMRGVRVVEPHKDNTPHWHMVMWLKDGREAREVVRAFRRYFLFRDGVPEFGQLKHQLNFDTVRESKGDIVGYLLKYISKNIDGENIEGHTDGDEPVTDAKSGAENVRAWASNWGNRQFQFIGLPPIDRYRELRRVREIDAVPDSMKDMWVAANEGDYCGYLMALHVCREQPELIKRKFKDDLADLAYFHGGIDKVPDDSIQRLPSLNKYMEPLRVTVRGIRLGADELITRKGSMWKVVTAPKAGSDYLSGSEWGGNASNSDSWQ